MSRQPSKQMGWFRGVGGAIWRIELPLPPELAAAHALGQLTRVNPDGTPYRDATAPKPEMPKVSASKAAWTRWAVACGADPEAAAAASKHDLIDAYGDPGIPVDAPASGDGETQDGSGERG